MSTHRVKPSDAAITISSREGMALASKGANLVDHNQLLRLLSVDPQALRYGTIDVTDMSDEEFLTHIFG